MKPHSLHLLPVIIVLTLLTSSLTAAAMPGEPSSAVASEPADADNWWIQRVEAPLTFKNMNPHSLGVNSNGVPTIVYGGDHLYRASKGRLGWVNEIIDPAWGVGSFASLAIDSLNNLHVTYIDTASGILRYATNKSGNWQIDAQFSGSVLNASNAVIALDSADDPHIVFYYANTLKYIFYDSEYGAWVGPETLATSTGALDYPGAFALAVGQLATPYVSYHKHVSESNGSLYYAKRTNPNTWATTLLSVFGDSEGDYNDIAVSGSTPYVAASSSSHIEASLCFNEVYFTFLDGLNWHAAERVTLYDTNDYAPPSAIALRLTGTTPYIAYQEVGQGYYWQTRTADNTWSDIVAIATGAAVGGWASFARYNGYLYATYYNTSTSSLYFNNETSGGWQTPYSLATNGHNVATQPSLAVDTLGRSHISYLDNTTQQLKYARYDGVNWVYWTVDTDPVIGSSSLTLANNIPRILYYGANGSVRYTTMLCAPTCTFIAPEFVDSAQFSAMNEPALAAQSATVMQAAYAKNNTLIYAKRIGTNNWSTEVIDPGTTGAIYGKVSLALDAGGAPYLIYRKGGNLYYTYKDTVWHFDLIADSAGGSIGLNPSFKISPQGVKTAVYTQFTGGGPANLIISTLSCPSICFWYPQTIATDADEIADLAFDNAGVPSIAYFTLTTWDLKLARRVAPATWNVKGIDSRGLVGFYTSLAASPLNGKMRIAYSDFTNSDMKLALEGEQVFMPLVKK